jgi:hypothetical protein
MARRAEAEARQTYLVEHYRPGLTVDGLRQWAARVRDEAGEMEREGRSVHYVRSAIVPADETLLCLLEAASEDLVRETYARAGLPFERLSTVLPEEGWAAGAAGTTPPDAGGAEHEPRTRKE